MTDENKPQPIKEVKLLKTEILGLFNQIQKIRHEIASIKMPGVNPNHFGQMSDELDAIIEATEIATNTIMENVENIDDIVAKASEKIEDEETKQELEKVPDLIGGIFEACSFQDITGQRVNKIIDLLKHVEGRVNSLVEFWGEGAILEEDVEADEFKKYLHGPAARGEGIAQDSVDSFFNGQADEEQLKEIEKESSGTSTSKQEALALGENTPSKPKDNPTNSAITEDKSKKEEGVASLPSMQQDAIDALFD
ncbi:MAG: protein phosphatase CheZ [Alphaproteobacteria bacterium]|nr:protein phosphatase CheZ [Alphaproteobacteria bacterium]